MATTEPLSTSYVPQVDEDDAPRREDPRSSAPAPEIAHVQPPISSNTQQVHIHVETPFVQYGQWRDGLCECFTAGGWPSLFMSCFVCCWPCLVGKIASRIRWSPGLPQALGKTPFAQWAVVMSVLLALYLIAESLKMSEGAKSISIHIGIMKRCNDKHDFYDPCGPTLDEQRALRQADNAHEDWEVFSFIALMAMTVILAVLRLRTRTKFLIPSSCEGGPGYAETRRLSLVGICEDAWCACCCACCTLAQMSRHTHASDDCSPCTDPGPAESMVPQMGGVVRPATQMVVMQPGASNAIYGHNATVIPVATSVVPVPEATLVGQGMPVPAPQV